ncbi:glycosyltransferase [Leifsonia sp. McL0607]|uniref:glycosyltransferase n=1 Tax=Leifsonia sp. McL0607 TaxID=3415672 RepID=UPI003CF0CC8D
MTTRSTDAVPTISVVIPCLNDASMLAQCLAALAAQTTPPFEVIVVDGGSTDDSRRVAVAAGARVLTATGGIPAASAAGLDAARGEVIGRLDADSRPSPDWLQRVSDDLSSDTHWSAVTGTGEFYDTGRLLAWAGRVLYLGGYFHVVGPILGHPPLFGSNFAILREEWSRLSAHVHRNGMDIHDDLDFSIQLAPDMTVLYDRALRVGVSGRQLGSWSSLRRHVVWSANTFALNRKQLPQRTRRRLRRLRRRQSRVTDGPAPSDTIPSE